MDLSELQTAMDVINALDPGAVFVHHVSVFISIAEAGASGTTYADLETRHGLSNAGVSRSCNALSEYARHRKTSLGLVELYRDVEHGKRLRVRVTQKGAAVFRSLKQL